MKVAVIQHGELNLITVTSEAQLLGLNIIDYVTEPRDSREMMDSARLRRESRRGTLVDELMKESVEDNH